MKYISKAVLLYNNKVISFADEIKSGYIMQFIRDISHFQLDFLAKSIKNIKV